MEIKRVPISDVEVWAENPRNIKTKDFERLKRQIKELGVYKPLICIRENGKYITLGGNMRLRALESLNLKEVDISIVKAKDEATKIKYALSDNDRAGEYDDLALAELTYPHIDEINLDDYKIDIGQAISLKNVIETYAPDVDGEEGKDEVPEIDDSPAITKKGDLFQIGKHRLLCGDCLELMKKMPDESIDMVITSPPYWGLRDYGIEQIFGGNGDCEHEWGDEIIKVSSGGKGHKQDTNKGSWFENKQNICLKCQAWKGQLGLEPTPEMYIEHLTEIFNEVKRVLKKEGTLWLNLGDTYGGSCQGGGDTGLSKERYRKELLTYKDKPQKKLMPKCLLMIPERLAWSLIQNGWILRNKIIWYKPNAMPSSVSDRFSNKWEYVYYFVKSNKSVYWTNKKTLQLVIKQPLGIKGLEGLDWEWKEVGVVDKNVFNVRVRDADKERFMQKATEKKKKTYGKSKLKKVSLWTAHDYYFDLDAVREPHQYDGRHDTLYKGGPKDMQIGKHERWPDPAGKNPGDVFEINTQPFPEAHFAVFPEKLCEKPIKAGCPEEVCKKCGKAKERITETHYPKVEEKDWGKNKYDDTNAPDTRISKSRPLSEVFAKTIGAYKETIGWTSCKCKAGFESGIVLDPFCGAGTVLIACEKLNRICHGMEIAPKYCDVIITRFSNFTAIPEKKIRATNQ